MNALLDHLLVGVLIAGAVLYFVTGFVRRRSSGKSCGSGCCTPSKPAVKLSES